MSLSNIIKEHAGGEARVVRLDYAELLHAADTSPKNIPSDFVPFDFTRSYSTSAGATDPGGRDASGEDADLPDGEQVLLQPGMVVVDEQEIHQRCESEYIRGMQEGRQQAERGLANVFRAMRQSVTELSGLREKVLRGSEDDLLKLAIMIARKITRQEIETNTSVLANIVSAAIADCIDLEKISIRLNPDDYAIVNADRARFIGSLSSDTKVILSSDETLHPGDCMVDSTTGSVDATIETQLEEIYRKFMDERGLGSIEQNSAEDVSQNVDQG